MARERPIFDVQSMTLPAAVIALLELLEQQPGGYLGEPELFARGVSPDAVILAATYHLVYRHGGSGEGDLSGHVWRVTDPSVRIEQAGQAVLAYRRLSQPPSPPAVEPMPVPQGLTATQRSVLDLHTWALEQEPTLQTDREVFAWLKQRGDRTPFQLTWKRETFCRHLRAARSKAKGEAPAVTTPAERGTNGKRKEAEGVPEIRGS